MQLNPGDPAQVTNPGVPDAPPPRAVPASSAGRLVMLGAVLASVSVLSTRSARRKRESTGQ